MSVLDQIRKLDEQKASLLQGAKKEALDAAHTAIKNLAELGFHYRLVQGDDYTPTVRAPRATGGTRRTGIRDQVLHLVNEQGDGITRSKLLEVMDAKGDKSAEQSISNALAALKKAGTLTAVGGVYKVA